jgi:hypothetical protein
MTKFVPRLRIEGTWPDALVDAYIGGEQSDEAPKH